LQKAVPAIGYYTRNDREKNTKQGYKNNTQINISRHSRSGLAEFGLGQLEIFSCVCGVPDNKDKTAKIIVVQKHNYVFTDTIHYER
jgi:hypothetical protein